MSSKTCDISGINKAFGDFMKKINDGMSKLREELCNTKGIDQETVNFIVDRLGEELRESVNLFHVALALELKED